MVGIEDGLGEGGFTDWDAGSSDDDWGRDDWDGGMHSGETVENVGGVQTETEDLTLLAVTRGLGESEGFSVGFSVLDLGGSDFGCVLNGLEGVDSDDSGFSIGVSGFMGQTGSNHFRGVLDGSGSDQIGDGSFGQIVGENTEAVGIGDVADADLLAFRVDVSVASDLVTEGILVVGSGLSGVGVTVGGLAELILRTVLAGGVSVSVVRGSGNNGSRGNHGGGNGGGVGSSNGGGVSSAGGDGESVVTVTVVA